MKIDLERWFFRLLSYWWLFILCVGIAWFFAATYIKNATPLYSTSATLLIKDAGSGGGISESQILLAEGLLGGGKSLDNEIQILRSLTIMEKVVEKLQANIEYFSEIDSKRKELYSNSPIVLDSFSFNKDYPYGLGLNIEVLDSTQFKLRFYANEEGYIATFGKFFNTKVGLFRISRRAGQSAPKGNHTIFIRPKEFAAFGLRSRVEIKRVGSQHASGILSLQMTDAIPKRAADVVNMLIEVYNEEEVNDKNQILLSTLEFIDERVKMLTGELDDVEGGIQRFKSQNEIITGDAASSRGFVMGEIRSQIEKLSEMEVKKEVLRSLETLLRNNPGNSDLIPANLIADNPVLGSLVGQYNTTFLERERLAKSASAENPSLIALEKQLSDIRNLILESLQNLQLDLNIPMRVVQSKIDGLQQNLSSVPSIDKKLLEQMRTQSIKENLFLFLLRKREETALSKAVTSPNTRMVDSARVPKFSIYPQKKLIHISAVGLGLIIPMIIVTILGFFETKVRNEDTITRLTSIPILGRIAFSKKGEDIVIKKGTRTAIAEMFRLLRTNLNYLNIKRETQVLLITSSVSGEGKSFIGLNLAMTIALSGKKVVLLGLDLRKPKMHKYLGAENGAGMTNYLISQSELPDVLQVYSENPNLSYITSGPIPPNPAELILSERMDELIEKLKADFDYVVIDSPPIGLVSDALLMRKFATNILVVVRQKYTKKRMLRDLETLYQNKELEGAGLVFNAVKQGRSYYGYGGGYYYGYGKGYYVED